MAFRSEQIGGMKPFASGSGQARRDVVALSHDDHPALASALAASLKKKRAELVEQLARVPAKDFSEYQKRIGVIEGIDIAIAAAAEVNQSLKA